MNEYFEYLKTDDKGDVNAKLDSITVVDKIREAARNPNKENIAYLTTQGRNLALKKLALESYLKGVSIIVPTGKAFTETMYAFIDNKLTPPPFKPAKKMRVNQMKILLQGKDWMKKKE